MMTDEGIKAYPWTALRDYADELTPEQFDYCVRECPDTALTYCADKLSNEQRDYCEEKTK